VIETSETGGNYVLGFRIDPKEKLHGVYKTLLSIQEAFAQHPVYGVEFNSDVKHE
jgi:Bardet-Biedl syndrome 5 protein